MRTNSSHIRKRWTFPKKRSGYTKPNHQNTIDTQESLHLMHTHHHRHRYTGEIDQGKL